MLAFSKIKTDVIAPGRSERPVEIPNGFVNKQDYSS
jgi:hypothetical protein